MGSRGELGTFLCHHAGSGCIPWEGGSPSGCWGGGYESVQGPPAGWGLRLQRWEPAPGLALDMGAWEGCRPGPSWLLAHCPPSCDGGEGLMHQWSCQRSCLAGCREVRLVFPIRPLRPPPEVSPAQLTLAGSLATGRPSSVVKENQVVQMMPEGEKQLKRVTWVQPRRFPGGLMQDLAEPRLCH